MRRPPPVARDDPLRDAVGREDGDLRCIEDRDRQPRARGAGIGDREGAAGQIVGAELLRPRPRRNVSDGGPEIAQAQAVGAVDDRHDEALVVEIHGDPQVHGAVEHERFAVDRRVESRDIRGSASIAARATNGNDVSPASARARSMAV